MCLLMSPWLAALRLGGLGTTSDLLPVMSIRLFAKTKTKTFLETKNKTSYLKDRGFLCCVKWFNIMWLNKMHMLSAAIKMAQKQSLQKCVNDHNNQLVVFSLHFEN